MVSQAKHVVLPAMVCIFPEHIHQSFCRPVAVLGKYRLMACCHCGSLTATNYPFCFVFRVLAQTRVLKQGSNPSHSVNDYLGGVGMMACGGAGGSGVTLVTLEKNTELLGGLSQ